MLVKETLNAHPQGPLLGWRVCDLCGQWYMMSEMMFQNRQIPHQIQNMSPQHASKGQREGQSTYIKTL